MIEWKEEGAVFVAVVNDQVKLYVGEQGGTWHWRVCRGVAIIGSGTAASEPEARDRAVAQCTALGFAPAP